MLKGNKVSKQAQVQFKNQNYTLSITVSHNPHDNGDVLEIQLVCLDTHDTWEARLVDKCISLSICIIQITDIEELTRKTGNFKRFSVFLEMLLSSIDKVE